MECHRLSGAKELTGRSFKFIQIENEEIQSDIKNVMAKITKVCGQNKIRTD
jgi:hypothetical protein